MKDRGSALLTAVISIMILVSISGVFFTLVMSHTKLESSEEKGLRAYYLAEAGIQYGIAKVLDGNIQKGDPLPELDPVDNPFGQGGSFEVQLEDSEEDRPSFIVRSTGKYSGIVRKKVAEYKYNDDDDDDDDDDCEDDDIPPGYPLWVAKVYDTLGTYVVYDGKLFYTTNYAGPSNIPGTETWGPWQEVTKQWRSFNIYYKNDIVCVSGVKFRTRDYSRNQQPGVLYHPWQELTDQWRSFNVYLEGDIITHIGKKYRAQHWTQNQEPGLPSSPWDELME